MDFSMGTTEEAIEASKSADQTSSFITEPGAYSGLIEKACIAKYPSGSEAFEIQIKTPEGKKCKVNIFIKNKKGEAFYEKDGEKYPLPGFLTIKGSLMPVLGITDLKGSQDKDGNTIYPQLINKRIGMLVNMRKAFGKKRPNKPTKTFTNPDLKTFFDPATNLLGSEILEKVETPKLKFEIEKTLRLFDETNGKSSSDGDKKEKDEEDSFTFEGM